MKIRNRSLALAAAMSVPLLLATSVSAVAADNTQADDIADVIEQAAPQGGVPVDPDVVDSDAITFTTQAQPGGNTNVKVEVPVNAADPVTIDNGQGEPVEISLPEEIQVNDAQVADDGTAVYTGADAHVAIQTLTDGAVRLQVILENPQAPTTYTYDLGDTTPVILDNGSIDLTKEIAEGVTAVVGTIDAPWATDANGTNIKTWYTIDNNTLTQHLTPSDDTAYPITADPTYGHSYGAPTVYLNWGETQGARSAWYVGWMCGTIPPPWNLLCAGNTAIIQKRSSEAVNAGKCVKFVVSPGVLWGFQYSCSKQQ